jgi:arylsulfatase A-like enzyme
MKFSNPCFLALLLFLFIIVACNNVIEEIQNDPDPVEEILDTKNNPNSPNILLIIADDMGLDASLGYNIGNLKPQMPNLQDLINTGLTFSNVWSNPTCTPTRATIITGKYGLRMEVVKEDDPLSTSEISLQKYIDTHTSSAYSSAVIGKWHLSRNANHPNNMGIDYYAGSLTGGAQSYWNWNLTIDGQTTSSSEYIITKTTNLAIDWLTNQTKPWFLWLAYNAPHTPFHLPPNDLHGQGTLPSDQGSIDANPLPYYFAMLEAMDTEYGRVLNAMSQAERDNTVIIFIGDNGTPNQALQYYSRGKGSLFQGGINVPMVVAGKNVSRISQTEDALINTTDLFSTIGELAGINISTIHDSKSFKDLLINKDIEKRDYAFAEDGNDNGTVDYAIRNATHKYILYEDGSEGLYDLVSNPLESNNLLHVNQLPLSDANNAIKIELAAELASIRK